jgi:hypothetical protein
MRSARASSPRGAGLASAARIRLMVLASVATIASALVTATPAAATYAAQIVSYCCYMTLEPGDKAEQFFAMRNTGTDTWYREGAIPVRLGSSNPMDRSSPFYTAGDWISPGRPTGLDSLTTEPGAVGRFTWIATAPQQVGTYTEFYAPLAEGVTWMGPGTDLFMTYQVIAAQAPTVRITASPARVRRGDAISVSADVTDNRGVARVTFGVGSQVVTATAPVQGTSGYAATLSSGALTSGTQSVTVHAYDLGGRESSASSAFEVYEAPPAGGPPARSIRLSPFTPLFTTRSGRGKRLGTLYGLGGVVGLRPGSRVRLVCVAGCVRRLNASGKASARGRLRLTLKRPLRLGRGTRVELRVSLGGYVTRFQRYRFRRTRTGTLGRFVSSGCLAVEKPRLVVRCPAT